MHRAKSCSGEVHYDRCKFASTCLIGNEEDETGCSLRVAGVEMGMRIWDERSKVDFSVLVEVDTIWNLNFVDARFTLGMIDTQK